jgi:hypothetical protein
MANPNIVNVTEILGKTDYIIPSTTAAATWTALTPPSGTIHKLNSVTAANVGVTPVLVSLAIHTAVAGGGTANRIAQAVVVPVGVTLVIIDKSASVYVGEDQSIVVSVSVSSGAEFVASYEAIK